MGTLNVDIKGISEVLSMAGFEVLWLEANLVFWKISLQFLFCGSFAYLFICFLVLFCLKQSLIHQLWLIWYSLCIQEWLQTHNPPASVSKSWGYRYMPPYLTFLLWLLECIASYLVPPIPVGLVLCLVTCFCHWNVDRRSVCW